MNNAGKARAKAAAVKRAKKAARKPQAPVRTTTIANWKKGK